MKKVSSKALLCIALALSVLICIFVVTAAGEGEEYKVKSSITLWTNITYNLYAEDSEDLTSLKLDGAELDLSTLGKKTIGGKDYYQVKVELPASEILRDVVLTVTLDGGDASVLNYTFSVYKYAKAIIEGNYAEPEKAMVKDVLSYARSAYAYFEETDDSIALIDALLGENYDTENAPDMTPTAKQPAEGGAITKATFGLGEKISYRFYTEDNLTFKVGDRVYTGEEGVHNGERYLEVCVYAYELIEGITCTDSLGNASEYNIYSYYAYAKEEYSENTALISLVERLVKYAEAAAEYKKYVMRPSPEDCEHEYSSSKVTLEPTPSTAGKLEKYCGNCYTAFEERIPTRLKLLAIGNSFSVDALEHLGGVLEELGVEDITLMNLYIGGCSVDTHWEKISGDLGAYTLYKYDSASKSMKSINTSAKVSETLALEEFDVVTLQQASGQSGKADKFGNLQNLINYVQENEPSADIYWHMTWAYQGGYSGLSSYGNSQMTMYTSILSVVNDIIKTNSAFKGIIPSGTAVQNLRTSNLGDTLTRDGFHMSYGIGRYTLALTWAKYLTGMDIDGIRWYPAAYSEVKTNMDAIKDAVNKAIDKPFEITESAYPPAPEAEGTLTDDDKAFLTANGYDPAKFELLTLDILANSYYNSQYGTTITTPASSHGNYGKFLATQIFTKDELANGSIIRINSGYQYRPEGWIDLSTSNKTRPDNVTENLVVVDDAWWGDFTYRAFNVAHNPTSAITKEEGVNFRIYVPVVDKTLLTADDRAFLTANGYDPDNYLRLELDFKANSYYNSQANASLNTPASSHSNYNKFLSTQMFSKGELALGTVIRVNTGYKYRPEAWVTLTDTNTASTRPAEVTANCVEVTDEWWGDFNYRGFNIGKTSGTITVSEKVNFVIYIPKVDKNGLSIDDRNYLLDQGFDPYEYELLDLGLMADTYYNSKGGKNTFIGSENNMPNRFLGTVIFDRYELVNGSIIRLDQGYAYRPEAWIDLSTKNTDATRPANVTSAGYRVVDDAWWLVNGTTDTYFNYRAFNIYSTTTSPSVISLEEGVNFRIYVPKAEKSSLTSDDRIFLESKGYNPDDYTLLDITYLFNQYYQSTAYKSDLVTGTTSNGQLNKFLGTPIFDKTEIPSGSLIRVNSGYRYRPEGWAELGTNNASRPNNVATNLVVVDDAWWGNFNYRGFNISRTDGGVITEAEYVNFKIYVPKSAVRSVAEPISAMSLNREGGAPVAKLNENGKYALLLRDERYSFN